ncbi:hypothetical protein V5799_029073 [Amblyomma americanum]|uniref:TRAF1-6 MATH domain-containing protein n=1 Tax=Amblyomma americanum TaxID=6943 RepID=A0AAQ4ES92_AMBAM
MASSAAEKIGTTYTLYGFGNDLDWRQTCFLEPLPPSRYCAYCGRVCATMMMLPCSHIVCAGCYGQCTRSYACALDEQRFQQHDVAVMIYSSQDLASKHAVSHGEVVTHLASSCSQKPAALLGVQDTLNHLNPADTRRPGAAGPFPLIPDQHANLEVGNVASSSTAFTLASQQHRTTSTSLVLPSPRQPEPLCDYRGQPPPAHDIYKPVSRYLREAPAAHAELPENPSCDTQRRDSMARRKAPASMELEIMGRLEHLSEPKSDFTLESIQMQGTSPHSASLSPETTRPWSYRYLDTAATLGARTLSTPKLNGGKGAIPEANVSNAATVQMDHAYIPTETAVRTQDTGDGYKREEYNSSRDQPALPEKPLLPYDKDKSDAKLTSCTGNDATQAAPLVVSQQGTSATSAPSDVNNEDLPSLVQRYVNSVCRFVSTNFDETDIAKNALCKLMPEDLIFVLKTSEEIRAQMSEEGTALSPTRGTVGEALKNLFQAAREHNIEGYKDVFSQEYVAQKIDNLINLAKLVLSQHKLVSMPVQWYLHNWSELKARALAAGEAADYFHNISATFYGYTIVPGLLLENTTGTLRLHFSFYLQRGVYDSFLEWPLKKELTLSIVHPTDKGKVRFLVVDTKKGQVEGCTKPETQEGKPISRAKSIKADYFDTNGYVDGNKLMLKFEVK